jgi:hypothetical protein
MPVTKKPARPNTLRHNRVGLLVNEPPNRAGMLLNESSNQANFSERCASRTKFEKLPVSIGVRPRKANEKVWLGHCVRRCPLRTECDWQGGNLYQLYGSFEHNAHKLWTEPPKVSFDRRFGTIIATGRLPVCQRHVEAYSLDRESSG